MENKEEVVVRTQMDSEESKGKKQGCKSKDIHNKGL